MTATMMKTKVTKTLRYINTFLLSPEEGVGVLGVGAGVVVGGRADEVGQLPDGLGPVPVGHGHGRAAGQQGVLHLLHVQAVPVREGGRPMHAARYRFTVVLTQAWVPVEPARATFAGVVS